MLSSFSQRAGDSRLAASFTDTGHREFGKIGWWVEALSNCGIRVPRSLSVAVGGCQQDDLISTQLPQLIAQQDEIGAAVFLSGANDFTYSIDLSTSLANYQTFIETLTGLGIPVVGIAEMPRGGTSNFLTGDAIKKHARMRSWLLRDAQGISPLYRAVDVWPTLRDQTETGESAVGKISAAYSYDFLHLDKLADKRLADLLVPELLAMMPSRPFSFCDPSDRYDATNNLGGNRITNGLMSGTGGGLNGVMTGTLADSFNAASSNFSGLSCVGSQVTTDTGRWQQFVFSGTSGASSDPSVFMTRQHANGFEAGVIGRSAIEFEVDAGAVGLRAIRVGLQRLSNIAYSGQRNAGYDADIPEAFGGFAITPDVAFEAGDNQQTELRFVFEESTSVSATIRVRNLQATS